MVVHLGLNQRRAKKSFFGPLFVHSRLPQRSPFAPAPASATSVYDASASSSLRPPTKQDIAMEEPRTYPKEVPQTRPHAVVRQLPPPALVHDVALVHASADQVGQEGDAEDDAEDATGPETATVGRGRCTGAGIAGTDFEYVGAVV